MNNPLNMSEQCSTLRCCSLVQVAVLSNSYVSIRHGTRPAYCPPAKAQSNGQRCTRFVLNHAPFTATLQRCL